MMNSHEDEKTADTADITANVDVLEVDARADYSSGSASLEDQISHNLIHRKLNSRQVQLTSIAGSIGALLFVGIGSGLSSGPIALIVGKCSMVEESLKIQVSSSGAQLSLASLNVFAQTSYVVFEATVINTLVEWWGYHLSPAILITVSLVLYFGINIYRADLFGEAEFWLALGKVLLALGLIVYTFITMVGGNPLHDGFGFRNWVHPAPWVGNSPSSRLESFINAVNVAGFCMAGPEYISMIAGEAKQPRKSITRAFKTIMARLIVFYLGGAICVGILVPSDDKTLTDGSDTYAGGSPYVISMKRLGIPVLPDIVTAVLLTVIFSAGNAYTFGASRSLHAMALDHKAPAFLRKTNKHGVPYPAVICVLLLSTLAYLALGTGSAVVLNWLLNFCTAATMFNWLVMSITWIRFNSAMRAQGIDRNEFLINRSKYQPYIAYWAAFWSFIFIWVQGYAVFLRGNWNVPQFIFNYGIIGLAGLIGLCFKVFGRTPFHRSKEVDLHSDLEFFRILDQEYDRQRDEAPPITLKDKILYRLF